MACPFPIRPSGRENTISRNSSINRTFTRLPSWGNGLTDKYSEDVVGNGAPMENFHELLMTCSPLSLRRALKAALRPRKNLAALSVALILPVIAQADSNIWNGLGVGANPGSNWDILGNYTGAGAFSSATDLDFSTINTASPVVLSAAGAGAISVKDLIFGSATSGANVANVTLNGTGVVGEAVINMAGFFYLPSPAGSVVTLGSDLTINLSNAAHRILNAPNSNVSSTTGPRSVLVLKSLVTGGGGSSVIFPLYSQYGSTSTYSGTPNLVLTNNGNTVASSFAVANLSYTSISSVNGGASSLGVATSAAPGEISISSGAFSYIGAGDQASDRRVKLTGTSSINNFSSSPSTLTLSNLGNNEVSAFNRVWGLGVSTGNRLVISSVLSDGSPNTLGLTKSASTQYFNENGVLTTANGNGTAVLSGANTYSGPTLVNAGTLLVANTTGSGTGTSAVTVAAGATFGGVGIVAPGGANIISVANGGFISAGGVSGEIGNLKLDGGSTSGNLLTMTSGAKFVFDLGGLNTSDKVSFLNYVVGDLTLSNTAFTFNNAQAGQYVLFDFYADGGTTLTASGLTGASFNLAGSTGLAGYTSSLDFGTTGQVILNLTAIPEPTTWALLGLGLLAVVVLRRRVA